MIAASTPCSTRRSPRRCGTSFATIWVSRPTRWGGIFDLPEADLGSHPADEEEGAITGTHNISFYCDDMEKKVAEMKSRGVEFTGSVSRITVTG